MKFEPCRLPGAFLIHLEPRGDERGFFARYFCREEFHRQGLNGDIAQINNSFSRLPGTLRGLHYQLAPKAEDKVVRCVRGSLWDVIVDLRPASSTFLQHFGVELSAENRTMLYVPKGFAHGFLTLEADTEALYLVTESYSAAHERGLRYNDPRLGIRWPSAPQLISERDRKHPDFDPVHHLQQ